MHPGNGSARLRQPLSPPPPGTAPRTITRIICANTRADTAATTCAIREPRPPRPHAMQQEARYDRRRLRRNSPATMSTGRSPGRIGHDLPQEAPETFAKAIVDVDSY